MRRFFDRYEDAEAFHHSQGEDEALTYLVNFTRTLGASITVTWSVKRGKATISNESESSGVAQAVINTDSDAVIEIKAIAGNETRVRQLKIRSTGVRSSDYD